MTKNNNIGKFEMIFDLEIKVEVINDGIGIRVNIYRPSYRAYH